MGYFQYDISRSEIPAKFAERRCVLFLFRWCPIFIAVFLLVAFVFTEHTAIANRDDSATVRAQADLLKKFSPYSYDSNEFAAASACYWPILTDDDLALLDPREETAKIECKSSIGQLFVLHESGVLIPQTVSNDFEGVECTYKSSEDLSLDFGLSTERPTFISGAKRILVECWRNGSIIYSKEFFNFAAEPKLDKMQQRQSNDLNLSLTIIALDSVSLTEFHRLMPLSSRYMRYMGFIDSEMFNKKDFNETVTDMLIRGEKPIWEVMRDRGCVSYLSGTISDASVDFSTVDFLHNSTDDNEQCSPDGTAVAKENLESLESFHNHHSRHCTFSLQTVRGFREQRVDEKGSARWFSRLAALDSTLRSTLERLVANKIATTAAIVVMGDLSNKHNTDTQAGRMQQSTPLFSIRMPHGFRSKRPEEAAMLYGNRKRLTANDDIKKTLFHIAHGFEEKRAYFKEFDAEGREKPHLKATSLFIEKYNDWRSCERVGINDVACQCLYWRIGRAKALGRESSEYLASRNLIVSRLTELSCIQEVLNTHSEPPMQVLSFGLMPEMRTQQILKDFGEGVTPRGDVEYFRLDLDVKVRAQPFREFWDIRVRGHVRHHVTIDKYQLLGEIAIIGNPVGECAARRTRDFCQMCTVQESDVSIEKDVHEMEGDIEMLSAVTHA